MLESLTHLVKIEPLNKGSSIHSQNSFDTVEYIIRLKQEESHVKFNTSQKDTHSKTLEEETIDNIKEIVQNSGECGIYLSDLLDEYVAHTGKKLEYEKLGYFNLDQFVSYKLSKCIIMETKPPYYETRLYFIDKANKSNDKTDKDNPNLDANLSFDQNQTRHSLNELEESFDTKLSELKRLFDELLSEQAKFKFEITEFEKLFEERFGFVLDYKYYGFNSRDQFLTELTRLEYLEYDFYSAFPYLYLNFSQKSTENNVKLVELTKTAVWSLLI